MNIWLNLKAQSKKMSRYYIGWRCGMGNVTTVVFVVLLIIDKPWHFLKIFGYISILLCITFLIFCFKVLTLRNQEQGRGISIKERTDMERTISSSLHDKGYDKAHDVIDIPDTETDTSANLCSQSPTTLSNTSQKYEMQKILTIFKQRLNELGYISSQMDGEKIQIDSSTNYPHSKNSTINLQNSPETTPDEYLV